MERQRIMLNEESVFLVDEFLKSAVEPLAQKDPLFNAQYGGDTSEIIQDWFDEEDPLLDLGVVPFPSLQEDVQKRMKQNVVLEAEAVIQARIKEEGIEKKTFNWHGEELPREEFVAKYVAFETSNITSLGFKLWELGELSLIHI